MTNGFSQIKYSKKIKNSDLVQSFLSLFVRRKIII